MSYCLSCSLTPSDPWQSLDDAIAWLLPRHTAEQRNALAAMCRIDDEPFVAGRTLPENGVLSIELSDHIEGPVDRGWYVVWERHDLMVVYKPHQLPVSRTTRNLFGTLISEVRRHTPWRDARLLHRLDAETAGLILIAKHEAADKRWKKRLSRLMTKKVYHATVWGDPEWQSKDVVTALSERVDSSIRTQMFPVTDESDPVFVSVKPSQTRFDVVARSGEFTKIECTLLTGRKHQIRAHLASLGHPIVGDKIYSFDGRYYLKRLDGALSEDDFQVLGATCQKLVAVEIQLSLPEGLEIIRLDEPAPGVE